MLFIELDQERINLAFINVFGTLFNTESHVCSFVFSISPLFVMRRRKPPATSPSLLSQDV